MPDGISIANELFALLQSQQQTQEHVVYTHTIPAHDAAFSSTQEHTLGEPIPLLYSHQSDALEKALQKENIAIATAAASGKTLATALPYLVELRDDPAMCLLCIAPTRALVGQWCDRLCEWCP